MGTSSSNKKKSIKNNELSLYEKIPIVTGDFDIIIYKLIWQKRPKILGFEIITSELITKDTNLNFDLIFDNTSNNILKKYKSQFHFSNTFLYYPFEKNEINFFNEQKGYFLRPGLVIYSDPFKNPSNIFKYNSISIFFLVGSKLIISSFFILSKEILFIAFLSFRLSYFDILSLTDKDSIFLTIDSNSSKSFILFS